MKICIELSRKYIKGDLLEFVENNQSKGDIHTYGEYGCPILNIHDDELNYLNDLCSRNKCGLSILPA